ncbi:MULTISPECIES: flagellar filament capping protein FliD [unclassified Brenneria]|uniref:flagellar filament capping protein FliD n=1 Tax=unclassified Brenneria TaxID=2634434 RepID=UPI0029C434ED|nr:MULTISPECIES: flagellar filament capping protein FliD [unclassified Brenneria]MDX5630727.1 flagellar filament capping protein FliD [Brenneria sp. L3-3Z]MDX5694221.1 flagellar filament capping protein FliD [Brenneria sp. L4-2C]
MASITSLGVGSGMDLSGLLTQLETAEKARLTPITTQQSSYNAKLSAFSTVKSALDKLDTATKALAKSDTVLSNAGSIDAISTTSVKSTNKAFTATTDGKAVAGSYSVSVSQLAQAHSVISSVSTSATTALSSSDATLKIAQANGESIDVQITGGETSLTDVRDAINKADGGVSASIVKANDNSYYLMLTSKDTGTEGQITVTDDSGVLGTIEQKVAAQNALISVNGIEIERQSNTIDDALEGVTLSLQSTTATDTPETLEIAQDTSGMKDAIKAWVDAYNAVLDTIATQTQYTAVDAGEDQSSSNGALLGDSTVRSIQSQLKKQLTNLQSDSGDIRILADLGITQNYKTGKLEVNDTELEKALKEEPANVKAFFAGDGKDTGFSTQMRSYLTTVLDSTDGVIKATEDGINSTLKKLEKQYTQVNDSITATIARYQTQFTQLDLLVSQLDSTASYLTSQFTAISNSK